MFNLSGLIDYTQCFRHCRSEKQDWPWKVLTDIPHEPHDLRCHTGLRGLPGVNRRLLSQVHVVEIQVTVLLFSTETKCRKERSKRTIHNTVAWALEKCPAPKQILVLYTILVRMYSNSFQFSMGLCVTESLEIWATILQPCSRLEATGSGWVNMQRDLNSICLQHKSE